MFYYRVILRYLRRALWRNKLRRTKTREWLQQGTSNVIFGYYCTVISVFVVVYP